MPPQSGPASSESRELGNEHAFSRFFIKDSLSASDTHPQWRSQKMDKGFLSGSESHRARAHSMPPL